MKKDPLYMHNVAKKFHDHRKHSKYYKQVRRKMKEGDLDLDEYEREDRGCCMWDMFVFVYNQVAEAFFLD